MTNQEIIELLATRDPKWQSFYSELPVSLQTITTQIPKQLVDDVVTLLNAKRPELSVYISRLKQEPLQTFDKGKTGNQIKTILTIGAILFLLQTHILIERPIDGGFQIKIEHHAMGDELVEKIVESINDWLPK